MLCNAQMECSSVSSCMTFTVTHTFSVFSRANPASISTISSSCCSHKDGVGPTSASRSSYHVLPEQLGLRLKQKSSVSALRVAQKCSVVAKSGKDKNGRVRSSVEEGFLGSPDFWLQVAVVVLTLGFIDAGYSGDWSRIGVISSETESGLRDAALGVVPLSLLLIWAINKRRNNGK
ncbi:hypothetical protein O6H91_19G011800 [Diphasiastrum complanatum]|uniref:Uncharacterized protein n=1 Tax=Diphasiastrum complanatum TaxID=34168 RepID=A0ACC2AU76_DIPCM|nr:hypothetical protein O6H91_19G011800 [Diphasiastrum complanatum]